MPKKSNFLYVLILIELFISPPALALSNQECIKSFFGEPPSPPATVDEPELQKVIANKYDSIGMFFDGLAMVSKDCKYGFIDTKGKLIVPLEFDNVSNFESGFATVEKFNNNPNQIILKGKSWFINKQGEKVFDDGYEDIFSFREGLAAVKKQGKWGFIDTRGQVVIPFKYDEVSFFYEDLANVKRDNQLFFIDKNGKEVIKANYDSMGDFTEGLAQSLKTKNGVILIKLEKKSFQ